MSKPKNNQQITPRLKPQPLNFLSGNTAADWTNFKEEWDAYEEASGLNLSTSTERVITFLRVVGKDALNVYNTFSWPEDMDARNIDRVIEKFEALCLAEKSARFQRYLFHRREQGSGETLDEYVADVKALGELCEFGDLKEVLLCDKIVFGLKECALKEELLKNEDKEIDKLLKIIKEKQKEYQRKQEQKSKALAKLKSYHQNIKKGTMADDIEMMGLEDDVNGEEVDYEEDATDLAEEKEDALIIKADDSDIEIVHEEEGVKTQENMAVEPTEEPRTKRETEFTSEDFKIEVKGLPRYYGIGPLKKLLNETLQLKAHKIKPAGGNNDRAYITFRDEKSRNKALTILDDYSWKNSNLRVSIAKPVEDPVEKKNKKKLIDVDPEGHIPVEERIVKSVTPFAHRTYEDQLHEKQKAALAALRKFGNEMVNTNPELKQWVKFHKLRRKGQVCEVLDIIPSPVTEGYRNKCEFTIGMNPDDDLPTVGFRVSSYKSGSLAVGPVEHLIHIPNSMKCVVKSFQNYVRKSELKPFCPLTHAGVWRQLTVRTSTCDDILIAVVIHPQEFTEEDLGDIKQDVVNFFKDGDGMSAGITSIFFQIVGQKEPGPEDRVFEHVWGEEYITETVLGKTFRISCESFFQVNTKACEALYETIGSLAELDGTSVILDICCGTGTIGVSLADQCLKVYGIEMVKKAAEDARHNAQLNGLDNVAIYTGKAEINMNAVLAQCMKYNSVGIVDPPRAGLSESVIKALRKCENMDRLIYMSCDPEGAFKNFIDLSRPKSKNYKGEFFVPIKAAVVDMFPHTAHYELLIVFERWEERKWRRIMEGNPLPRDEEYYNRIPAKPEGVSEADSDDEEVNIQKTGIGNWKCVGDRRQNREGFQPYTNPRQQAAAAAAAAGGGGGGGGGYSIDYQHHGPVGTTASLMGDHPYDDGYFGSGGAPSNFDSYYNSNASSMQDRVPARPDYDRMPARSDYDRMPARSDYDRMPARPDYDRMPARPDYDRMPARPDYDRMPARPDYDRMPARPEYDRMLDRQELDRMLDRRDYERMLDRQDFDRIAGRGDYFERQPMDQYRISREEYEPFSRRLGSLSDRMGDYKRSNRGFMKF